MKSKIKFLKIMLRLWALMLAVTLVSPHSTKANVIDATITPASALEEAATEPALLTTENDMKVLRLTTTAATIQLRLHDADSNNYFRNKEKLATTTRTEQFERKEEVTATLLDEYSTLASSNAPATITNAAKEISTTQQATIDDDEQQQSNSKSVEVTITPTFLKPYSNNDELEREIKDSDFKQVTESVAKQHPIQQQNIQPITTEVSWQKETDIKQQTTESTRNADNGEKGAETKATQTQAQAHPTSDTTATEIWTNTQFSSTDKANTGIASPVEQNKADQITQKEIAGNNEGESLALTLAPAAATAIENFKPVIESANEKLIRERTIFSTNNEWKQNLMPNELEYVGNKPFSSKTYEHNINWSPYLHSATPVNDFTGKLLQDQDGVITEIEQKFRLNDFDPENESKTTKPPAATTHKTTVDLTQTTTFSKEPYDAAGYSVNRKILDFNKNPILNRPPVEFIERRVKKSFDFPMHRVASDAQHLPQHFDFANTKFNSNSNDHGNLSRTQTLNVGDEKEHLPPSRPQPEFSTTKFYNSKELYNEMLQHKIKQQQSSPEPTNLHDKAMEKLNSNGVPSLTLNSFAVLHSPKVAKLEELHETKLSQQQQKPQQHKSLAIKKVTVKATKHTNTLTTSETTPVATTTIATQTTSTSIEPINDIKAVTLTTGFTGPSTVTELPLAALVKTKKFQKELKRAKLLIKSMMPKQNTTTNTITSGKSGQHINTESKNNTITTQTEQTTEITSNTAADSLLTVVQTTSQATPTQKPASTNFSQSPSTPATETTAAIAAAAAASKQTLSSFTSTNTPKTSLHPILRPRILSRLQEKINSLECELQNLPQDSHLWRGNETHELLLPIMTPENCKNDKDCTAMMVSWEGEADIQSGDILIVEINDALLTPKDINLTTSAHNTQVYQVTRSGHEHCDVTEGILLDITPLIVDGRKLVTLYDKDLTEGVNLLIVVSELWGAQCVRLKVTTKTENCGENADCSGKGICYSNYDMEEYECQCCSGFAGPHCEEIDACTPSPCTNNGICVDLSQGHEGNSYQCLCPYGYTGKNCQYELDPCNPADCMNGGSCIGNSTHFRCDCSPGYTGPLCQHSLNECESSPCVHGICVDQEDGFRCFCQPGFAGELCNFEYNECESNPCQNGGECIDHIGSYECHCSKGYTGNRCQIKVDFCANKPCPEGRHCIDHGNDYSCECLGGRNGPDCNEMQRTQCNVNPCTHGGTCWSSGDSFYCACRPGYTGTMCEDEFVVETVVSSSEFMVDDTSARNFNDKSFGSSVVLKSPIELHNAYTAAIVLALVIFGVALYLTICHCKVNQTYRKFSTRTYGFLPILGFRMRTKQATSKINRHWLSGKGLGIGNAMRFGADSGGATTSTSTTSALHATAAPSLKRNSVGHLPTAKATSGKQQQTHVGQLSERPFQRHLAMNLENDMYYTVDFSENSQHSPLIQ